MFQFLAIPYCSPSTSLDRPDCNTDLLCCPTDLKELKWCESKCLASHLDTISS